MAERNRDDTESGFDEEEAARALRSALSKVAPAGSAVGLGGAPSELVELLGQLDAAERGRLAEFLVAPASTDAEGDAPTPADAPTTDADSATETAAADPSPPAATSRPPEPASDPPSTESLSGRYELVKLHARGGIGQVWLARDRQLPRRVAVKELQPKVADRDDLRARFLIEAEIIGRLEHPGIVPIHSLGEDEKGRPYYAMRFVRGDSLVKVIRDFHRARREAAVAGEDPARAWGLEFHLLLRRFVGACETLEYAHSQGCIHRDLKPGNIMVGPYGETLVVDWGLGKILDAGPEPAAAPTDAADDEDDRRTPISATRPGDRIGTPQYMSPEQALGALEMVGPLSDVYSLGATLFELLTGRAPFEGKDKHAVVVEVLRGAKPPRSALASVPPALDAVCAKAMAFRADERYPSAGALARDLENWLADEPVSARREPRRERLARWLRRYRSRAAAGAIVLATVSLVATIAALAVGRSWRNESTARALAERNFEAAQATVDKYLTRISQDELLSRQDSVDMRRLRRDLLREALAYYERFAREHADDDRLRRRLAEAYENVGTIQLQIAAPADAIGPLEAAVATWDELVAKSPRGGGPVAERAWALLKLGQARKARGSPREALAAFEESAAALEPLVGRTGGLGRWGETLADGLSEIAAIRAELGAVDASLAASAEARRLLEELSAALPEDARLGVKLAEVANNQGFVSQKRRDLAGALRRYEECRAICRERLATVAADAPRPRRLVELLGVAAANSGDALTDSGRYAEAERAFLQALETHRPLAETHPTVIRFRSLLGHVHAGLGSVRRALGRDAEALASLDAARSSFDGLLALDPDDAAARGQLARTLNAIGCIRDDRREHREAAAEFRRAIAEYRAAIANAAEVVDLRYGLSHSLANLAEQYADMGDATGARAAWDEAARGVLDVLGDPAVGSAHLPISLALAMTAGDVRLQSGDVDAALAWREEFAVALERCRAADAETRESAGIDLDLRRAVAILAADRPDAAAAILAPLTTAASARGARSEALWLVAVAARRLGSNAEADAAEAARAELWRPADAGELVARASTAAHRACLLGHGRSPLPAVGEAARALDARMAAADLALAMTLGFPDRDRLRRDADLMTALDRPESRGLRDDLLFPEFPFAPDGR